MNTSSRLTRMFPNRPIASRCLAGLAACVLLPPGALAAPGLWLVDAISNEQVYEEFPFASAREADRLALVLAPGEFEPGSFVVQADEPLDQIEIEASPLVNAAGLELADANIDVRIVTRWYQRNFGSFASKDIQYSMSELLVYDDTLIKTEAGQNYLKLESGDYQMVHSRENSANFVVPAPDELPVRDADSLQPFSLAAGEWRQLWVTVYVPDDAAAGMYASTVSITSGESVLFTLPVEVEVLPFTLEPPPVEYSIYYRGRMDADRPEGSPSSEVKSREQMYADFVSMKQHGITSPVIYQKIRTGLLEDVIKMHQEVGFDSGNLYLHAVNIVSSDDGTISPRIGQEVREAMEMAKRQGIGNVYFYARDEARGEGLEYQFPFWDVVRDNGGKIFAAGWMDTRKVPGNFSITDGREDVFVALGTLSREEAARWHSRGKKIFSYQNPTGGTEFPATWRRNYGLLLWQFDYDGAMPYPYQHSYGEAWNDFDHPKWKDHNFTYPTIGKPIDTLQWEGFREGVDDMRYLATLQAKLASDAARSSPYYAAARNWVDELKTAPLAQLDADEIRATMTGYILALGGYLPEEADCPPMRRQPTAGPVNPDGSSTVTWETTERADVWLPAADADDSSAVSPRSRTHSLRIDMGSGKGTQSYLVSCGDFAGSNGVNAGIGVDMSRKLAITDVAADATGGILTITGTVTGAHRASIGFDLGNSLVGWWRFAGNGEAVTNLVASGADGALKGNATRGAGWFGQGAQLAGDGSFVNLPDVKFPENGTGSIEGWFRFNSFAKDTLTNMAVFSGVYQHSDNNHFYFLRTNDYFAVGSLLTRDVWHHIVLTWDGDAATAKMYVDGHFIPATTQGPVDNVPAFDGLNLGRSAGYLGGLIGSAGDTLDGNVDEVRVWNRVLSLDEVRASYDVGRGQFAVRIPYADSRAPRVRVIGADAADNVVE